MKENFLGLNIDIVDKYDALRICNKFFESNTYNGICFINSHCYKSSLILNDGIGMKIGMKLFNINEKENMNGTDFIPEIIRLATTLNKRIYLLGCKPGVVDDVEKNLRRKFLGCNIVGKHHGYFNEEEEMNIIEEINSKKVDLLIVGMGVPIQELWLDKNKHLFKTVRMKE